ncbi:MAG: phage integrase SAM-like domain-containing protein [Tissierellia bacterium]|nr:phage integrase SAM-like domain-containing protein [Tissierellia bacterium]
MAVNFYLDNRPNKNGDYPIRVSISINGNRYVTSTGFSVNAEKWHNGKVKNGTTNAKGETSKTINARLKEIDSFFSREETLLKLGDVQEIDIKTLFAENFAKKKQEKIEISFFGCFDEFTTEMGKKNNWTKAVYEKFNALKNHLIAFKSNIKFSDLNERGLNNFVDYLHTVVVAGKKTKERDTRVFGMKNTTIKKQLGFLKWFLRWATAKGYNKETSYQTFKPKLTTPDKKVVFLDWDELMTVYNFNIPESKKYLDRVRDVFCFCSFTSLRYSDVANLKRSDVFDSYISITTIKTADSLTIELNDYSKAILKKYEKDIFPNNSALPVISNQRMNEYLKELGELCGLDAPVTITYYKGNQRYDEVYPKYALIGTHTARRTFISNALMLGIPPQTVMKWTGHSDYKAMKPYIDIADRAKAESMKMFNKK